MNVTIACIGSGNMGFALMHAIAEIYGKLKIGFTIGFADADREKAKAAAAAIGVAVYASNAEAAEKGDFIFLAVKPQVLEDVLAEIAPVLKRRIGEPVSPVLVSMAAGWTIGKIQAFTGGAEKKIPVARIKPNTPALIG
jgi:pyrroline-5-carboxylate reductase